MSSRVLIPVLCVGAVLFACGPRTRDSTAIRQSGTAFAATGARATTVSRPATKKKGTNASPVKAQIYVRAHDAAVRLALYVENTGSKTVELTFPSGQTHDFVILDTIGREMWRWSRNRMFTQTLRNRLLNGGESISLEETWRASTLPPGTYVARATLTSENFPLVQETTFSVPGTRVAAR